MRKEGHSHTINKTNEKIAQHYKKLKKKYRGDIKIRHRQTQADTASGIYSAKSNISKAMSSRKPKKSLGTPGQAAHASRQQPQILQMHLQ